MPLCLISGAPACRHRQRCPARSLGWEVRGEDASPRNSSSSEARPLIPTVFSPPLCISCPETKHLRLKDLSHLMAFSGGCSRQAKPLAHFPSSAPRSLFPRATISNTAGPGLRLRFVPWPWKGGDWPLPLLAGPLQRASP